MRSERKREREIDRKEKKRIEKKSKEKRETYLPNPPM
jgi:hypothetical protein